MIASCAFVLEIFHIPKSIAGVISGGSFPMYRRSEYSRLIDLG